MSEFEGKNLWALIIGGSSGMGLASAQKLASHGMNIIVVHKDRRSTLELAEKAFEDIRSQGVELISFNKDGVNSESIQKLVNEVSDVLKEKNGRIKLFLHSIAQGNLKALVPRKESTAEKETTEDSLAAFFKKKSENGVSGILRKQDFDLTVNSMGISLFDWVRLLLVEDLFAKNARIIGLTSEGNDKVWGGYAAVATAKSALETLIKYFAVELAPYNITANLVQAGVTETPSLNLIPGSDFLKAFTTHRNPQKRLTQPEDIANVIYLLCKKEANWINGTTIIADGGEHLV